MSAETPSRRAGSYWRVAVPMSVGFAALLALVGGLGFWSIKTELAGAVIASGSIELQSNRQVIQHPDGGVVGEILAKDGDSVNAGDVVIRFEDTQLRSEQAVIDAQLAEISARRSRLEAERDGADEIGFAEALRALAEQAVDVQAQIAGQKNLFEARRDARFQQAEQLREQIAQSAANIDGTQAQLEALRLQLDLIGDELKDQRDLLERGLTQASRVTSLERERARLLGDIGAQESGVADIKGRIAGLNIEILKLDVVLREEAIANLRDLEFREIELRERRVTLTKQLDRISVKAPVAGIIYGSSVFALQSVVQPAAPIMFVIPQDQPLVIYGKVEPMHIEQIYGGQPASLMFTAFDQRTTPELHGEVSNISADVLEDPATNAPFYRVEISPGEGELDKLSDNTLLPGMPVEIFLKTDERTPLSYLVKPLTDYFERALRG